MGGLVDLNFYAALASIAGLIFGIYSFFQQKRAEGTALAFVQAIRGQATSLQNQLKDAGNIQNSSAFPELRTHVKNSIHAATSLVSTIETYESTLK